MIKNLPHDIQLSIKIITLLNLKKNLSKTELSAYFKHEANLIKHNINYSDYIKEIGIEYKEQISKELSK